MKSALITGTSSGIGRAAVRRLADDGWLVFAGVRTKADAKSLAAEPGEVVPVELDVTDAAQIEAAVEQVSAITGGRLDALVNNAGIGVAGPLEALPPDGLRQILDVNVVGQVAVTQALLPLLRRGGAGRILFVGSVGGRVTHPWAAPTTPPSSPWRRSPTACGWSSPSSRSASACSSRGRSTPRSGARRASRSAACARSCAAKRASSTTGRCGASKRPLGSAERKGEEPAKVAAKIADALGGSGSRYPVGRGVRTLVSARPLLPDFVYDRLSAVIFPLASSLAFFASRLFRARFFRRRFPRGGFRAAFFAVLSISPALFARWLFSPADFFAVWLFGAARRCERGTSWATAPASCLIWPSRNSPSAPRLCGSPRASLAVSLSPTLVAKVSSAR